jgi:glycosyltransferase involved in cell wall biosynthesis
MHALLIPSWFDTPEKPWRGSFFRDQARALQRQGVRVGIACVERRSCSGLRISTLRNNHFQTELEDDRGVAIARMKAWSIFVQTTAGARLWCALMKRVVDRYIHAHGVPDVIHAHAALWGGYAAAAIARTLDRPFVITEHSSAIMGDRLAVSRRRIVSDVYREAAAVIAVSNALGRSMRPLLDDDRALLVPNTVDTTFFTPPRRVRSRSPFRFLAVCDLVAAKRVDLLIQAFAALRRRGVEATLTIVGAGPEREHLEQLAFAEGVTTTVHFTGAQTRDGVRREMWRASALVVPSDCETFGVVLIEALSTGLPVIATRCGGPAEIVSSSCGYLVEPGDITAMTSAMHCVTRRHFDPAELHSHAVRHYDYHRIGGDLVSIYRDIIDSARDAACA